MVAAVAEGILKMPLGIELVATGGILGAVMQVVLHRPPAMGSLIESRLRVLEMRQYLVPFVRILYWLVDKVVGYT